MVCAPVRSIIPSLKLGDYLSVQAHKPCSISHLSTRILKPTQSTESKMTVCRLWFGRQILYKSMTFFRVPFTVLNVLYLLSNVKIVVCICIYSILNKILLTLNLALEFSTPL